ncbi:hypothetical protein GCM10017691_51890 [Pseudonocardia petroleophila]
MLAFAVGAPGPARWVTGVHGASGLGLLLLVPAKSRIARRGLRRPGRSRKVIGWAFVGLVALAVGSGLLHALWGWAPVVLGLLPMQVHVGAAVGVVVLLAAHLRVHRRRPLLRRTDLDRRRALLGTGVVAGSALLWVLAPGRARRETGSHEVPTVPVTQWMFDPVPRLPDRPLRTPAGEVDLAALPTASVRAVLDCTGGWYSEQEWRGVPVSALGLPASASIDVVSATGYRRRFPASGAGSLLLATHLAGRPLSAGHGAPVRLVAPGRRGFWWVKWVVAVEVVDEPWWWQPPFPLQ